MIYLDDKADTFPDGLKGTPFEIVYKALRKVAAEVWTVDPTVYRAGMGWGWSALQTPDDLEKFRKIVINALISAFAPLIKDNQTNAELVEYLRQWREYTPTFPRLQALYSLFGVSADIQPISDPESQSVIPVTDTTHAFYVRITPIDMARLLTLSEAYKIALGASPLGSHPYAYYALESDIGTSASPAPVDEASTVFVVNDEIATEPEPPRPRYIEVLLGFILSGSANNPPSVSNMRAVTFDANDYWFGYLLSSVDVDTATAFGLTYNENYLMNWDNSFRFEPLDLYTDDGQTSAGFDLSNFYCGGSSNTPSRLCIKNYAATAINTLTWKCRITKRSFAPYIDVLFGLRYQNGGWQSKTFSANDYWYAGILSEVDRQDLEAFGCTFVNSEADYKQGPIGTINGNDPNFTFEPIALYSDLAGQSENVADMSNFYCYHDSSNRLQIHSYSAYNTPSVTWKCRITRVVEVNE